MKRTLYTKSTSTHTHGDQTEKRPFTVVVLDQSRQWKTSLMTRDCQTPRDLLSLDDENHERDRKNNNLHFLLRLYKINIYLWI